MDTQQQVLRQCKNLLLAANEAHQSLAKVDVERVFYALQNLLNAGANISKALWGQRGKLADQRKPLRDSIGINDNSPLREVTMRNNFEHFDERLDKWWKESPRHIHIDNNIGPPITLGGADQIDKFRHFDPQTTIITFWGQEFNLQKIVDEVQRILPTLEAEASKPHRETW